MSGFLATTVAEGMGNRTHENHFEFRGREVTTCDKKAIYGRKNVHKKFFSDRRSIYIGFYLVVSYLFYNFASVSDCIHCKSYFMITLNLHIFGDNR
ncbi:hypothetical protein, partial [Segatella copri]|uniref:hypothetical protein n=1 Tax=Segatella copri TaxID=165179 RepID=UPI001EE422FB